jgi:probable phosphoglycerate mutase
MGHTVSTHVGLRERHFGVFQGRTFDEVEAELPDHAWHWRKRTPDWSPPEGGESLLALRERIVRTVDELAARHAGQQIVLVAHGGVLDILYRAATRLDLQAPRTWQLTNTAVNRLLWTTQGLSLVGWGDTSHLDALGQDETSI